MLEASSDPIPLIPCSWFCGRRKASPPHFLHADGRIVAPIPYAAFAPCNSSVKPFSFSLNDDSNAGGCQCANFPVFLSLLFPAHLLHLGQCPTTRHSPKIVKHAFADSHLFPAPLTACHPDSWAWRRQVAAKGRMSPEDLRMPKAVLEA